MKTVSIWVRWLILVPFTAAVFLGVQVFAYSVVLPYLQNWVIDDPPGTYEVSSHFLWDWILNPLAFLFTGATSTSLALSGARAVAPLYKVQTVCIGAVLLVLYALGNLLFAFFKIHAASVSQTVSAVGVNLGVGIVAILQAKQLKSAPSMMDEEVITS